MNLSGCHRRLLLLYAFLSVSCRRRVASEGKGMSLIRSCFVPAFFSKLAHVSSKVVSLKLSVERYDEIVALISAALAMFSLTLSSSNRLSRSSLCLFSVSSFSFRVLASLALSCSCFNRSASRLACLLRRSFSAAECSFFILSCSACVSHSRVSFFAVRAWRCLQPSVEIALVLFPGSVFLLPLYSGGISFRLQAS